MQMQLRSRSESESVNLANRNLPGGCERAAAAMQPGFASAMRTCTQDATPELAKQTGCQRTPGKVRLWLDPIQLASCCPTQPSRISRQNRTTSPIRQPRPCTIHCSTARIALATIAMLQMQTLHLRLRLFCECNRGCSCTAAPIIASTTAAATTM